MQNKKYNLNLIFRNKELQELETTCKSSIKQHLSKIQEFFNQYMGVYLDKKLTSRKIKIKTQDDYILEYIDEDFIKNFNLSEYIQIKSLEFHLTQKTNEIQDYKSAESISKLCSIIKKRISEYEKEIKKIINKLFNLYRHKSEAFGKYYKESEKIEINLITCYFFCLLYNLDLKSFIITTFAHELAHYFNHKGKDKDGLIWDDFWDSQIDAEIIEGLAQYYSMLYANNNKIGKQFNKENNLKYEDGQYVFNEIYREQQQWNKYSKECVYQTFILARRNKIKDIFQFRSLLKENMNKLSKHS